MSLAPPSLPHWFWPWAAWRDMGGPLALRPPSAPRPIPKWAWARYLVHVAGRKPVTPPNPSRPYSRWTLDQIGGFTIRFSWGLTSGQFASAKDLVEKFRHAREPITGAPIRCLGFEGWPASNGTTFEGRSMDNEPFMDEAIEACHKYDILAELWQRDDQTTFEQIKGIHERHPGFDRHAYDIEVFPMVDPTIPAKVAADPLLKDMPRLTLYAGMVDAKWYADLIKYDFATGTQAYAHENGWDGKPGHPVPPGITLAMNNDAWWRGCRLIRGLEHITVNGELRGCSIPMIGVNHEGDGGLEHQLSTLKAHAPHYGIEWGETLNAADLALLGI